jgi:hypothetical protein
MSYYIAPQNSDFSADNINELVIYRVVKRLKDFKAEDGKRYRVFKSKKDINTAMFVPIYVGINGKLKKEPSDFLIRF